MRQYIQIVMSTFPQNSIRIGKLFWDVRRITRPNSLGLGQHFLKSFLIARPEYYPENTAWNFKFIPFLRCKKCSELVVSEFYVEITLLQEVELTRILYDSQDFNSLSKKKSYKIKVCALLLCFCILLNEWS